MKNFMEIPEKIREINKEEAMNNDGYEDDEEEKIETFFALIRGYQEARNRRRNELKEIETSNKKMRSSGADDRRNSGWVPAFQWEDFKHENDNRKHPLPLVFQTGHASFVTCVDKGKDKKMEEENNEGELDLTLAL
ncbi:hypothetical protein POM88_022745 [Heracleum sosnowskyi]|uniref:Protein NIM1-INTERACTING 1 n=1 Tax=Heracleum sosnowskyi TaxID=360622 RepID=A0AAD8IFW1_9APIA|nr:hypothetical protein POM88_022745 [Heracleum sosnowskyi]